VHWWMNIPPTADALKDNSIKGTVTVPAATKATTANGADRFGRHKVHILYNYEPSKRLRFYQFDPVHHDVTVFSVHLVARRGASAGSIALLALCGTLSDSSGDPNR